MTIRDALPPRFVHRLLRPRDYQPRPQLDAVSHWWRTSHTGVCALEGIGGAGKTAIVERLLRILPGVMPAESALSHDGSLPSPDGVFVFSFYDAPNPETFFWELATWLLGDLDVTNLSDGRLDAVERQHSRALAPPYSRTYAQLARMDLVLLVLDGMEKVQDDGARGGVFGTVSDSHLKDFLFRAADGHMPNVGVLVTTRFRLQDLYISDPLAATAVARQPHPLPHYRTVSVERLTAQGCIDLLQRVGAKGTEAELLRIATDCGFHALTVDLCAGYIVRFLGGHASAAELLPLIGSIEQHVTVPSEPAAKYVHDQATRFARVATRYRDALASADPAALALLQRICLFRLGASEALLKRMFFGQSFADEQGISAFGREEQRFDTVPGRLFAALSPEALRAKLDFLVDLHLLEATGTDQEGAAVYTTHPAIREGFSSSLDAESARIAHDAARTGLLASLSLRPGENYATEPAALDVLEEVVFHAVEAGLGTEAHHIYIDRLGGFRHVGWTLGDFDRGVRLCRSLTHFVTDERVRRAKSMLSEARLRCEWALYLSGLGHVGAALQQLDRDASLSERVPVKGHDDETAEALSEIYLLAGRPRLVVQNGFDLSDGARAHAYALLGDVRSAMRYFDRALPALKWIPSAPLRQGKAVLSLPTVQHCVLLLRLGLDEEVERGAEHIIRDVTLTVGRDAHIYEPPANLLLAEVAARRGHYTIADKLIETAQKWALDHGARGVLSWSSLVRARITLGRARRLPGSAPAMVSQAMDALETGLRIAQQCGFGIYFIDLKLEQAQAFLLLGDDSAAEYCIRSALYGSSPVVHGSGQGLAAGDETTPARQRGFFPSATSGLSVLLAATHPDCDYTWGSALGLRLLAEVSLLRAAKKVGAPVLAPASRRRAPREAYDYIEAARRCLKKAIDLQSELMDCQRHRSIALEKDLGRGILTSYPLQEIHTPDNPAGTMHKAAQRAQRSVFISYAHSDNVNADSGKRWLDRLLQHITPLVRQRDLSIWSDQHLSIGDTWHEEIRRSLESASAAVLLISPAYLASEYVCTNELPILLKKAKERGLTILPVILRPCLFRETMFRYPDPVNGPDQLSLSSLQAANAETRPLSAMTEAQQDEVLLSVARRLLAVASS